MGREKAWRVVVPLVFAAAGFLFATSAGASDGADLRPQDPTSLSTLVRQQRAEVDSLRARANDLRSQNDALSSTVQDSQLTRLEQQASKLREAAGFTDVTGPGLRIMMDDAPSDQPRLDNVDVNFYVVHQQDLQEVANALWAGGAKAISLQGQRLISTTGIKCVGNTVVLQGYPYSPPYIFEAVGPTAEMQAALAQSSAVQTYIDQSKPPINLGWDLQVDNSLAVPAFEGAVDIDTAKISRPEH